MKIYMVSVEEFRQGDSYWVPIGCFSSHEIAEDFIVDRKSRYGYQAPEFDIEIFELDSFNG